MTETTCFSGLRQSFKPLAPMLLALPTFRNGGFHQPRIAFPESWKQSIAGQKDVSLPSFWFLFPEFLFVFYRFLLSLHRL
ncbi:hypothetical protein [Prevotella sp. KH2C16]|uniref:hypothetical protein n=1 Tax=Prevotella sp. KH2C16 TaxID=1855325 RepID=UPI0015A6F9B5|nr:hypothetical protein [Prevotella sp. KH2C16]